MEIEKFWKSNISGNAPEIEHPDDYIAPILHAFKKQCKSEIQSKSYK